MFPAELQKRSMHNFKNLQYSSYRKIDSVEVEGTLTTKYILFLNDQILKDLLPEDLQQDMDFQMLPR